MHLTNVMLSTYTGETVRPLGQAYVKIEYSGLQHFLSLLVVLISAAPIVVVGKRKREDVRVYGDFSVTYNAYVNVETYHISQIEDMHSALRGCTVFSV